MVMTIEQLLDDLEARLLALRTEIDDPNVTATAKAALYGSYMRGIGTMARLLREKMAMGHTTGNALREIIDKALDAIAVEKGLGV